MMASNDLVGQHSESNTERGQETSSQSSFAHFLKHDLRGDTFGEKLAWFLCACAIITSFISIALHLSVDYLLDLPSAKAATLFWVISVFLAGSAALLFAAPPQKAKRIKSFSRLLIKLNLRIFYGLSALKARFSHLTFWSLPHILILAFLIRIIPIMNNGLYLDEWYWLESARRVLAGVLSSPFGFIGDQPANFTVFPVALLLGLTRNPVLAVRLTGVIYSLITITFLYFLAERLLGKKAAAVGALLYALSVWDIHVSNLGWNNVNINPLLVSGVLYFLYKIYTNEYSIRTLFVLAFLLAVCLHLLYVAALMSLPVLLVFLILLVRRLRHHTGLRPRGFILFGLFLFICVSPLFAKLIRYPQESIGRHAEFVQQNADLAAESLSPIAYYFEQAKLLVNDFTAGADNFRFEGLWGITLDPIIQALAVAGLGLALLAAIRRKASSYWFIIIFTLGVLLLIPFILLYRTSSVWRSYAILPIVYLLATFSLVQIAKLEARLTQEYVLEKKDRLNFFLTVNFVLYLVLAGSWFASYFDAYLTKSTGYETTICQPTVQLINKHVPAGSTIYLPDELCAPLITVQYEPGQYRFVPITASGPEEIASGGGYLVLLNSQRFGYYVEALQKRAEQLVAGHDSQLITDPLATQPVLYVLK
jgi:hypothetical protein